MDCCVCVCCLQAKLLNGKTNKEESATDGDRNAATRSQKKEQRS